MSVSETGDAAGLQSFGFVSPKHGWLQFQNKLFSGPADGSAWEDITPRDIGGYRILEASFLDERHVFVLLEAAANPGTYIIEQTRDGGLNWQSRPLEPFSLDEPSLAFDAVHMGWLDADTGWLAFRQATSANFSAGVLFKTADGGESWIRSTLPIGEPISFVTADLGWISGGVAGDSLFRTSDGGLTWQLQTIDSLSEYGSVSFQLPTFDSPSQGLLPVIVADESGGQVRIYSTQDGGNSWNLVSQVATSSTPVIANNVPVGQVASDVLLSVLTGQDSMSQIDRDGTLQERQSRGSQARNIVKLEMADALTGWARKVLSFCPAPRGAGYNPALGKQPAPACRVETQLLFTPDGGLSWTRLELPEVETESTRNDSAEEGSPAPGPKATGMTNLVNFAGQGFDSCMPPSLNQMWDWWVNSPYGVWNLYMGGSNLGCKSANRATITPSYVAQLHQQGWKFIPTWVGLQASCSNLNVWKMSTDPATAYSQGVTEANAASDAAAALGFSSTIIYYDLESFSPADQICKDAAKSFISGWVAQLHIRGYRAALYGSPCTSYLVNYSTIPNVPDAIWIAAWYGEAGTVSYTGDASVWDVYCLSNSLWSNHQRLRQYAGDHDEHWGSTTLEIDSNVTDGWVAVPGVVPWYGSVTISSDRPVVAVGRPHIGAEVTAYDGFASGSLSAFVPMLFKSAFDGSYDSAFYIQNVHTSNTASISLQFYDSDGNLSCSLDDTVQPLASKGYWLPSLSCLPPGWVGGVVITSDQPIVAVGRPHIGDQVMTYNGFSSGSTRMYVPMLFRHAWAVYDAALYIQNTDPSHSAAITVQYFDNAGNLTCSRSDELAPRASRGYWMPSECVPDGWAGGAVITSDYPIVAVGRPHIGSEITTYSGFASGSSSAYIPMLFKGAFGGSYDSAFYVQNVDDTDPASITLNFFDSEGNLSCSLTDTVQPLASKGFWVPSLSCLPPGWVGGAVVTSDQPVVSVGRPHIGSQITTYTGFPTGDTHMYLPMLFKHMWTTYDSAFYIQNTAASNAATVTLKFYDVDGNLSCTRTDTIPALSTLGYWVPSVACEP